jgi:hypothetical protein
VYLGLHDLRKTKNVTGARAAFTVLVAAWLLRFCSGALLRLSLVRVTGGHNPERCGGCLSSQLQVPSGMQILHSSDWFEWITLRHSGDRWGIWPRVDRMPRHSHTSQSVPPGPNLIFATDKKLPRYSNSLRMEVAYVSGPVGDFPIFVLGP